jgi:hypothetical protein
MKKSKLKSVDALATGERVWSCLNQNPFLKRIKGLAHDLSSWHTRSCRGSLTPRLRLVSNNENSSIISGPKPAPSDEDAK